MQPRAGGIVPGALAAICLLFACMTVPAVGQPVTGRSLSAEELQELVGQAGSGDVTILVIERAAPVVQEQHDELALAGAVEAMERRLVTIGRVASADLGALASRLRQHWPGARGGLAGALSLAVLACAIGWGLELLLRRLVRRRQAETADAVGPAQAYRRPLRSAAADLLGIALQIAVAVVVVLALTERGAPEREVGYAVILIGCLTLRLGLALIAAFLREAHGPAGRAVAADAARSARQAAASGQADAAGAGAPVAGVRPAPQTASLRRKGILLVVTLALLSAMVVAIRRLELGIGLFELSRLVVATGFVAALAAALWSERRTLSAVVFRDPDSTPARVWPWLALAYLAGALGLFAAKVLSAEPVNALAILAPIYCGAIAWAAYALCMVLLLRRRGGAVAIEEPGGGYYDGIGGGQDSGPGERRPAQPGATGETAPAATGRTTGEAAAIAGAIAAATWAGGVALAWGVPVRSDESDRLHGFWSILLILLLARIGWVVVRAVFDRRIAEESSHSVPGEPGDEGGGKGSRLGTILPLFRTFLFITVGVIAGMIVLSRLGLDIAPIFAGAGLVGVAVGFGAQSLVRDIFSGLFFLIDDAFRVGEYIETGGIRGTVERISIRSMQLRHQNGPLHTIPFGEIPQLTNYSRDWVIMKLPIRVTFDTDPERVRKLIKKLGQELMADPLVGDKFVEPLKSQGVREIDDSGQVIRVKFMTRPGEQFVLRKTVYARLRELFEREGIEFAAREVRVRVTTHGDPLPEAEVEKIAGAAAESSLQR